MVVQDNARNCRAVVHMSKVLLRNTHIVVQDGGSHKLPEGVISVNEEVKKDEMQEMKPVNSWQEFVIEVKRLLEQMAKRKNAE